MSSPTLELTRTPAETVAPPLPVVDPTGDTKPPLRSRADIAQSRWTCAECAAGFAIGESFVEAGTSTAILSSLVHQHLSVCQGH